MDSLGSKAQAFLDTLTPVLGASGSLRKICAPQEWVRAVPAAGALFGRPYWALLPEWLDGYLRRGADTPDRGFLDDILWAQYCLFMFIRLQDRVFDRHSGGRPLVYIADQYLLESERQFAVHFSAAGAFWEMYRSCLRETTLGILRAETLRRREGAGSAGILSASRNVNAIFRVGAWAVCSAGGGLPQFNAVEEACGHFAEASRILDDFTDLAEDLKAGRANYVALKIMESLRMPWPSRIGSADAIAEKLLTSPSAGEILAEAKEEFTKAFSAISFLGSAGAAAHQRAWLEGTDAIMRRTERRRFALLLAGRASVDFSPIL
jgi:hypothetical protein